MYPFLFGLVGPEFVPVEAGEFFFDRFVCGLVVAGLDLPRGAFVDARRGSLTVGEWADDWLAGHADLAPTTRNRNAGILSKHVRPRWGRVRLADVTHAEVQRWLTRLDLAPASGRKVHRVLSMLLAYGRSMGDSRSTPRQV